jgi:hypothetical protein
MTVLHLPVDLLSGSKDRREQNDVPPVSASGFHNPGYGFLAQVLAFHTQTTFNRGLIIISVVFGLLCEAAELKEVIMVLAIFVMSMGIYCQLSKDIYLSQKLKQVVHHFAPVCPLTLTVPLIFLDFAQSEIKEEIFLSSWEPNSFNTSPHKSA